MPRKSRVIKEILEPRDPLVPCAAKRLEAMITLRGRTRHSVAQACGVTPQQLDQLASGEVKRCRRRVLETLANELRAPGGWRYLAGQVTLHEYNEASATLNARGQLRLSEEEELAMFDVVLLEVTASFQRALGSTAEGESLPWVLESPQLARHLAKLLMVDTWRAYFLRDDAENPTEISEADYAEFAIHMSAALTLALRPWLEGSVSGRSAVRARPETAPGDLTADQQARTAQHAEVLERIANMLLVAERASGWVSPARRRWALEETAEEDRTV